jgi:hypothetical protein
MSSNEPQAAGGTQRPERPQRERELYADDQRWIVREIPAPAFDRRGGNHLLFETDHVMRRVRVFPVNWDELTDAELYALTDHLSAEG